MAKAFKDLVVWQKSIDLTLMVYRLTAKFPASETYGLQGQMRRAAVSISSNIAEGSARGTKRDFKQFVCIARGSNHELQTQLVIAGRLGYVPPEGLNEAEHLSAEVGKMLSRLEQFLASGSRSNN